MPPKLDFLNKRGGAPAYLEDFDRDEDFVISYNVITLLYQKKETPTSINLLEDFKKEIKFILSKNGVPESRLDNALTEIEQCLAKHRLGSEYKGEPSGKGAEQPPTPTEPELRLPDKVPDEEIFGPGRGGIVKFLEEGWPAPYVKAGILTRPDLHRLDPKASMALRNLLRNRTLPDHIHLPERGAHAKQLAADPERLREAWRIKRAHERQRGR